ncbi:hypothetical protein CASFOL_001155 [Castilleja foliolosa]|uniref:Uncharacterized protein n=1 Tax=Castilleja foliolosa TaxID=1961234 RepID=A0ABD3EQM0_9LAMI
MFIEQNGVAHLLAATSHNTEDSIIHGYQNFASGVFDFPVSREILVHLCVLLNVNNPVWNCYGWDSIRWLINETGNSMSCKENPAANNSPTGNSTTQNMNAGENVEGGVDTSIDQLYENVCDMQSSDRSPLRPSFGSDGDESRIDSELRHLVGSEMKEVVIIELDEDVRKTD